ncbi:MAG: AmmeMemoRadiSam system protein B, partial [Planctomycetia bacterium]|nr:AmmeMemoRadiSam system protein B [Planctomycetia bacterium]
MGSLDRPKLRLISTKRFERGGRVYAALEDPLGVFTDRVLVPLDGFQQVVRHFDGETSLTEIRSRVHRETGQDLAAADLEKLVSQLDRAMVLDGPTYGSFRDEYDRQTVRPAAFAGRSYADSAPELRAQLGRYFAQG